MGVGRWALTLHTFGILAAVVSGFRRSLQIAAVLTALCPLQGCLVLSLHPAYDDESIAWDPALIGTWNDADDISTLRIAAAEWRSYKIHYEHPSEKGDLTGYLTVVGDTRYLDVAPVRGQDVGSFLLPVHAVLRMTLEGDTLTLAPLSYDVLSTRLKSGRAPSAGLEAVLDQKQNVLITSPTTQLRSWLRATSASSPIWGAPTTFARSTPATPLKSTTTPQFPTPNSQLPIRQGCGSNVGALRSWKLWSCVVISLVS